MEKVDILDVLNLIEKEFTDNLVLTNDDISWVVVNEGLPYEDIGDVINSLETDVRFVKVIMNKEDESVTPLFVDGEEYTPNNDQTYAWVLKTEPITLTELNDLLR